MLVASFYQVLLQPPTLQRYSIAHFNNNASKRIARDMSETVRRGDSDKCVEPGTRSENTQGKTKAIRVKARDLITEGRGGSTEKPLNQRTLYPFQDKPIQKRCSIRFCDHTFSRQQIIFLTTGFNSSAGPLKSGCWLPLSADNRILERLPFHRHSENRQCWSRRLLNLEKH